MKRVKLKDVFVFIRNGKSIKQSGKLGYPITRIETIANRFVDETKVGYADIFDLNEYEDYLLQKGDILMSHINSIKHLGKTAIFESDSRIIHGMNLLCLRPSREKIIPRYAYYYLNSKFFLRQLPKIIKNSVNQSSFNITNLKKLDFILLSLEDQKKIVEILDHSQALIDRERAEIELYNDLIQSIFHEMFGDKIGTKNYVALSKVVEINPRKSEISNLRNSYIKVSFVPMENVLESGKLLLTEERQLNEVYSGYTYFKENDILFAKITPCMENGKGCIARNLKNGIGFGSTEFHVLRPNNEILNPEFIFYLTKSRHFRKIAESKMTGSAGQKRVPTKFLKNYKIPLPPLSLQNEFADKVQLIEKQKEILEESLQEKENLFNALMDKAFKGELV